MYFKHALETVINSAAVMSRSYRKSEPFECLVFFIINNPR